MATTHEKPHNLSPFPASIYIHLQRIYGRFFSPSLIVMNELKRGFQQKKKKDKRDCRIVSWSMAFHSRGGRVVPGREDGGEEEANAKKKAFLRCASRAGDELQSFRSCLRWLCVDQSNSCRAFISWTVFFVLAIVVPALSHFVLSCPNCDKGHRRPYDKTVQLSLTVIAALSFICLSAFVRRYGLRRFLFLDKLREESEEVRSGYTEQLNVCVSIIL